MELGRYFSEPMLSRALAQYSHIAAVRRWPIAHKSMLYDFGISAFSDELPKERQQNAFDQIYEQLRRYWQVFRGGNAKWSAVEVYQALISNFGEYSRNIVVTPKQMIGRRQDLKRCIQSLSGLKSTSGGRFPFMPAAKFLHFYNPALFPIYDTAVIWNEVFARFGSDFDRFLQKEDLPTDQDHGWLANYVVWAMNLVASDGVMQVFSSWYCKQPGVDKYPRVLEEVDRYSATAFEFVAIGAASLDSK